MHIDKKHCLEAIKFGFVGTIAMLIHYGIYYILLFAAYG